MLSDKTCIVIVGPTAAGKTALSLKVAEYFNTEIISADSRQCYKELNIGVAKPDAADLQHIKHYFINSHSVQDEVNASIFENYALQAASTIFDKHNIAVMVGGTGLYVKAFCSGMDAMPEIAESIRTSVREGYEKNGIQWLQEKIREYDTLFYSKGEMQNPQRMMRALEVKLSSGRSVFELHSAAQKQRDFSIIKIGIEPGRTQVYNNINRRVDNMMENGLLEEVKELYPLRKLNALQTVGYKEIFEYLDGQSTLEVAVENIKKNTRHYAKRQLTWFKKDETINWFDPQDLPQAIKFISANGNLS